MDNNFINLIRNQSFTENNLDMIKKIEELYNKKLDKRVKELMKVDESKFYKYKGNNYRLMGISEIFRASDTLKVDFVSKKYIPLIDSMDNDFICYDIKNDKFCLFNIVEKINIICKEEIVELINNIS